MCRVDDWREQRRSTVKHGEYLYRWSGSWAQGGPIIEREKVNVYCYESLWWEAECWFYDGEKTRRYHAKGSTPLIAAMRCYVASRLGDEVDIPDELI